MRYYKPHDMAVEYYRVTDVQELKVVDGNLEAFHIQWYKWLAGLKTEPPSEWLEPWYYEAVRNHKGIAVDVATYDRLPEGSGGDRSYEFLVHAVDAYVERQRKKNMTDALTKGSGKLRLLRRETNRKGPQREREKGLKSRQKPRKPRKRKQESGHSHGVNHQREALQLLTELKDLVSFSRKGLARMGKRVLLNTCPKQPQRDQKTKGVVKEKHPRKKE